MTRRDEQPPDDEPAVWRELVATFHESVELEVPPWPAAEDVDESEDTVEPGPVTRDEARPAARRPRWADPMVPVNPPSEPFDDPEMAAEHPETIYLDTPELDAASDDEHFVPPPPLPLPQLDTVQRLGWLCLIGGPLYLILTFALNWSVPEWTTVLGAIAGAGGFVILVAHMQDRDDDDPHGGAVV